MLNSLVYVNCCTLNAAVQPNVASHCCMPNTYKGLYSVCVCVWEGGGGQKLIMVEGLINRM